MLRYYMYVYLCGAAITAYVGFLKLRFEEMDKRVLPAFERADSDGERSTESARNRTKRHIPETKSSNDDDPLMKKLDEFRRAFQTTKLQKLQHRFPSESRSKVTGRQSSSPFRTPQSKTLEDGTGRTRMRKKRQTEEKVSTEKEMRKQPGRAKRDKLADKMLNMAHASKDQLDIYRGDPNQFFDEENQEIEDNQVQEGVAKQLFVVHWIRTLGYFIFLQLLIFFILLFAFWSYGYYRYELWKSKVDGFYKEIVEWFKSYNQAEVASTTKREMVNEDMEIAMEKIQDEEEKRDEVLSRKELKREQREALQNAAFQNVQRVIKERERRKKSADEQKNPKKKDKLRSTKTTDGKTHTSKSHKKVAFPGKADDKPKEDTDQSAKAPGTATTLRNVDPNGPQMVPGNYYPGYDVGYYPGYYTG